MTAGNGTGNRGRLVDMLMSGQPRARLAAVCGIYPDRIGLSKAQVPGGAAVPVYRDPREPR